MKKLLYTLSMALVFSLGANATVKTQVQSKFTPNTSVEVAQSSELQAVKFVPKTKKNVKRGAATAADFVGEYKWSGDNWLVETVYPNEGTMSIAFDEEDPTKLTITGLLTYSDYVLTDCYVENGKLYVPNQYVFTNTLYNEEVWFWAYTYENATRTDKDTGEEYASYEPVPLEGSYFYFQFADDGYLIAGELPDRDKFNNHTYTNAELKNFLVGALEMPADRSGWFWLCRFIEAERMVMFSFNKSEWKPVGTALFKDAWFPIFWEDFETPSYEVPLYRNYADENRFLLYQPYGEGTPYEASDIDGTNGCIIFNIENPDCVVFEPLVYSVSIDYSEQGATEPDWNKFYNYNEEGLYYYLQDASYDDIIVNFGNDDVMLSWFDPKSADGPVVEIYNGVFSNSQYGITAPLNWIDGYDELNNPIYIPMEGWIILPEDYDAVNTIGAESEAAPVYFNLQGVRVNNPEKGQIVIVKKGNKTSKQVVR